MSVSTASTRKGFGHTAKRLFLGALIACIGVVAFAGPAKAAPFTMDLANGQLNLGFAFKGATILPAPSQVPANPLGTPATNSIALPDLWDARSSFSEPGLFGGTPLSFKPAGCATPVTFGVYAALNLDPMASPTLYPNGFVQNPNPSGAASGGLLVNPLANAGPASDPVGGRTLAAGAIVPAGTTVPSLIPMVPAIVGPYPATDIKWVPYSVAGLPPNPPTAPGTKGPLVNPSAPCNDNPARAKIQGELVGNAVTITSPTNVTKTTQYGFPSGFRFPIMTVPNPTGPTPGPAIVPISIASTGDVTGTFDAATGALSLSGPIEARVLTGLASNPLGSYCALPLVGLTLSTTSNADFPGVPFTKGIDGPGALTGTYNITNDATSVGDANCGTVNSVSKGLGSIWLANAIAVPPTCEANTTGVPPNCVPIPCPAGFTGNEPDCVQLKAKIGSVKVTGPAKLRKGKAASYRVAIKNTGNAQATSVRLRVSGRGIKVNSSVGKIGAGKTRTVTVRVRPARTGKVKAAFRVTSGNAGSKTVRKTVRIR